MRDNHLGMPEILKAYERDAFYFGAVRIVVAKEPVSFEFGVDQAGCLALRKILRTRAFSDMPGIEYRYFFAGPLGYGRRENNEAPVTFDVRIEQGNDAGNFEFLGPTSLVSNLIWFTKLRDLREAGQLKRRLNSSLRYAFTISRSAASRLSTSSIVL